MRGLAFVAIIAANVLGGFSYYWTVRAIEVGLTPGVIAAIRSVIACAAIGGWLAVTSGVRLRFTRQEWIRLGVIGVFATGMPLVLGIVGTHWSTPGNASILILLEPASILFFSWLLLREHISMGQIFGLALGLAGAYLVLKGEITSFDSLILPAELFDGRHARGNLLLIIHAILWGLYSPVMRPLAQRHRSVDLAFAVMMMSLLPVAPLVVWESNSWKPVESVGDALLYVFLLGVVVSVFVTLLWNFSLRHLRASTIAPFILIQPIVGILTDYLLLDKPLSNGAIFGGVTIAAAVILVSYPRLARAPDPDVEGGIS